jgi:quercetin dioxygenase-like cupin family protein
MATQTGNEELISEEQRLEDSAQNRSYKSPYQLWRESQGLDVITGFYVDDIFNQELKPWAARNGSGIFINLDGASGFNDSYIYELAPGESSVVIKHVYDELIFVLSGRGATAVWNDEDKKQMFEWKKGSYFAIPPNASHQHFNGSGAEPARYFGMTAAPRVIDTFKDLGFVFDNPYKFKDIFNDEPGYFTQTDRPEKGWNTNYISDVYALGPKKRSSVEEIEAKARAAAKEGRGWKSVGRFLTAGEENKNYSCTMLKGTVKAGISFGSQPGTHPPMHRHGPGIHVTVLTGHGYSYIESPAGDERVRVDWHPGTVFVPPEGWWHAHYNVGPEPWDWLRVGWGTEKPKPGGGTYDYSRTPQEGGDQIAFEDMDPQVHLEFEEALKAAGRKCLMLHHPHCSFK